MWEKKHEILRRHSPFSSLDGTRSIYSGQCGGILLPWPPGSYSPFFCIYSTLIFLWETLPPWLLEYLFHMLLTPLWALAKRASRIISRISTWFTKSQWEPCSGLLFKLLATSHLSNAREEAIWEWCQPKGKHGWEMQETWPADVWATDQTQAIPGLPSYGPE